MARILCFCEKWESGGVESFVTNTLENMDRTGLDIDVVACGVRPGVYDVRLARMGLSVKALGSADMHAAAKNLAAFRHLLSAGYDVVHLNVYEGLALLFARAAKRAGVPRVIVHSHNSDLHPGFLRPAKLFVHKACVKAFGKFADERWAPSCSAARFMFGGRPWTMVKNGIMPERFAFDPTVRLEMRRELGLSENDRVLGCVGRLCEQKNQIFLVDVLAGLGPETTLLLVGEDDSSGVVEGLIEKKARARGVAHRIRFLGSSVDVARLYQAMDVLCVPSLFEGLGIVVIEAQAAGLPVVCSPAIPGEAVVSDLVRTVEFDAPEWSRAVRAAFEAGRGCDRNAMMYAAGYDVRATASFVRSFYDGSCGGEASGGE